MPSVAFLSLVEQFLGPVLPYLIRMAGGAVESALPHILDLLGGHLARAFHFGKEWTVQAAVNDLATDPLVVVSVFRGSRSVGSVELYALALTAAHQKTLAALLGTFIEGGEKALLEAFAKVPQNVTATGPIALPG